MPARTDGIIFGSCVVITIWMAYFSAATLASGVFLVAGWRSKQAHSYTAVRTGHALPYDPLWDETETDPADSQLQADAGAALRLALKRLGPVIANRFIQAEVAAVFGLRVRMHGAALADLLEEMLGTVIHAAPASRILLTAVEDGDHVAISITDDIPNADLDVRSAGIRALKERIALRGGTLDVRARPNEGTTVTLLIDAVGSERLDSPLAAPATTAASALNATGTLVPAVSFGMNR
jgi:hypothetical protein